MLTDLTFVALAMVATPSSLTTAPAALARESRPTEGIRGMHLETSDGLTLSGTYYEPNSKRKMKAPAAILIHTAGAERESLDDLARYLQRKGVGVLTFDLRGHGESKSERIDWEEMDERMRQATWSQSIRDIQAAAAYLKQRGEIHNNNLSVIGVETGSTLAVKHALDDTNVRAVVLFQPSAEAYGFNLQADLEDLEGLPTAIASSKDLRDQASALVNAAHGGGEGTPFVDLMVSKGQGSAELLADSKLKSSLWSWLRDHVMPSRR